ncbi:hypothetical protein GQ55_1G089700 [Panicum hallii var. hallii]|uniref:Uncharacterized protein n=1 Tax=Panicum hallii var. hallii TaxID=1504633 RepID=A0A2T7F3S9_9POAL|nr:hypothetical protein GQ55_1G089700 [Panicum hallii var. hallii]PUZ74739.1 hypothetical protein GQ55_1G089700 [Panicum hallii var. hallii]
MRARALLTFDTPVTFFQLELIPSSGDTDGWIPGCGIPNCAAFKPWWRRWVAEPTVELHAKLRAAF